MCDDGSLYGFPGLPDCLKRIAREELRENESLRKQSLEQMRDWIAKNPRIKNCRTDDVFLLRFLRTKKFSVVRACETLQKYLTIRQTHPKWFKNLDPKDPAIKTLLDYCALLPVGRDSSGRIVVLGMVRNFDATRHGSDDMIRLNILVTESLLDDEANQIAGFTHVFDNSEMTMAHVTCWTLENIAGYLRSIVNGVPIRLKQNHFVNVPNFAAQVSKYCLSFTSEKLKTRIYCHRSTDELRKNIELSVLPEEYGGTVSLEKLNENFKTYLLSKRDMLLALDQMEIVPGGDPSMETGGQGERDIVDAGAVGSFRKLQID